MKSILYLCFFTSFTLMSCKKTTTLVESSGNGGNGIAPTFTCANGTNGNGLQFFNTATQNPNFFNGSLEINITNTDVKPIRCCYNSGSPTVATLNASAICSFASPACVDIEPNTSTNYQIYCIAGVDLNAKNINVIGQTNEAGTISCTFPDTGNVAQQHLVAQSNHFSCETAFQFRTVPQPPPIALNQLALSVGYYTHGSDPFALMAKSTDGGSTWIYPFDATHNSGLPNDFFIGYFLGVQCISSTDCMVGGIYQANSTQVYPMLGISSDGGDSWSYTIDAAHMQLPSNYDSSVGGEFDSVACSPDGLCVAAGNYSNGSVQFPMIAVSTDGGVLWNYTLDDTHTSNLPPNYSSDGGFTGISCVSNPSLCVIVGSYNNGAGTFPLLAVSSDNGQTWNYIVDDTHNKPSDYNSNGTFSSINCTSGTHCVASGRYNNGTINLPMIAVSIDPNSTNWTYTLDGKNGSLPLDFLNQITPPYVSCLSSTICTLTSSYTSSAIPSYLYVPLIANSLDGGLTWIYSISVLNSPIPYAYSFSPSPWYINCIYPSTSCIMTSVYGARSGGGYPAIASSPDNGKTWTYSIDSIHGSYPANYDPMSDSITFSSTTYSFSP